MHPNWFECHDSEFRTRAECVFVVELRKRAMLWQRFDIEAECANIILDSDRLVAWVDVLDPSGRLVLLPLRSDFLIGKLMLGRDSTGQFVEPLDPFNPAVLVHCDPNAAPEFFARLAADWFEAQFRRPIVRYIWRDSGFVYTSFVTADDGRVIVWSDTSRDKVDWSGAGDPDETLVLRDFSGVE